MKLDLKGQRFGKLTVIERAGAKSGKVYWKCQCDCGTIKDIQGCHLVDGSIQSCGCEAHKKSTVPEYRKRIKVSLVEAFQHKCCICGLEDDPCLYDFHHLIPEEKEFGIGNGTTTRSKQAYADEAKKCIMVCGNCHRRIENKLIDLKDYDLILFDENKYWTSLNNLLNK